MRFELRADGNGCVLTFTHAIADRDTSARTAAGWDRALPAWTRCWPAPR